MLISEYFKDWYKLIPKKELMNTINTLNREYKTKSITPEYKNVFKAFTVTPYNSLKAVWVGQDPYPQKGVATGILFGNNDYPISPSLQVIKDACIKDDLPNSQRFDITLESWAKQGILMLNSALTVEEGKIGSHVTLWRPFIAKLLQNICSYNTGLIFVFFGNQAQSFIPYVRKEFNYIIKVKHPAYYARNGEDMPDFFKQIDDISKKLYNQKFNWYNE
jgi:uracil-DNA glycosylase